MRLLLLALALCCLRCADGEAVPDSEGLLTCQKGYETELTARCRYTLQPNTMPCFSRQTMKRFPNIPVKQLVKAIALQCCVESCPNKVTLHRLCCRDQQCRALCAQADTIT